MDLTIALAFGMLLGAGITLWTQHVLAQVEGSPGNDGDDSFLD